MSNYEYKSLQKVFYTMDLVLLGPITNEAQLTNLLKKLMSKKSLTTKNHRKQLQGPKVAQYKNYKTYKISILASSLLGPLSCHIQVFIKMYLIKLCVYIYLLDLKLQQEITQCNIFWFVTFLS